MDNKIEFICPNIEDFNKLKTRSEYFSELTHVISIHPSKVTIIKNEFPGLLEKYVNADSEELGIVNDIKPSVYIEKNKIYLKNADIDIINFLECTGLYSPQVKVGNLPFLLDLVDKGILTADKSFTDRLFDMDENSLVTDLLSDTGTMNFKGKRFRLSSEAATISDFEFDKYKKQIKTYLVRTDLTIDKEYNSDTKILKTKDKNGIIYDIKYFFFPHTMSAQLKEGRKISIMSDRILGNSEKGYIVTNPRIIPNNYPSKIYKREIIVGRTGKFPNLFLNSAYTEYLYRKKSKENEEKAD